ncbi:MAG TPA: hypothetical protein VFT74_19605, partial [Isosphaeraceae bacterium]|nr:hypothetical protein [Isosphaeraceae bacterium]
LAFSTGSVSFLWTSKLPMPVSPKWDSESLELEKVSERLNRYRLSVTGLEEGEYVLKAGYEEEPLNEVATATAKELAEGVDLTTLEAFPTVETSLDVLKGLETRNQQIYQAWRKAIAGGEDRPLEARPDEELKMLCQPRAVKVEIRRKGTRR